MAEVGPIPMPGHIEPHGLDPLLPPPQPPSSSIMSPMTFIAVSIMRNIIENMSSKPSAMVGAGITSVSSNNKVARLCFMMTVFARPFV
jgi:hypothetical protein